MAALAVWVAICAAIYAVIDARLKPTVAMASKAEMARGEVLIPRSRDGHYYVKGSINGTPVTFMVDTGASTVSVGADFARRAGLPRGEPARFNTAGGVIEGEMVANQTVEAGGIRVTSLRVGVGMRMSAGDPALLGQNFLRYVDVIQSADRMVLRMKSATQERG